MRDFILVQYKLYQAGGKSIGIDRIHALASLFLTDEERAQMAGGDSA